MITEIRMLAFSAEALAEALRLFGQATHDRYYSVVRDVEVRPGTTPVVTAKVGRDGSDTTDTETIETLEFTSAEVAAALILFCRRRRIPLPRHAEKSLRVIGGELCLVTSSRPYANRPTIGPDSDAASESPEGV